MDRLKIITPDIAEDNSRIANMLREEADRIESDSLCATGVAIIVTFANGAVATCFSGPNYIHLLGGVGIVQSRLMNEFEK